MRFGRLCCIFGWLVGIRLRDPREVVDGWDLGIRSLALMWLFFCVFLVNIVIIGMMY